MTEQSRGGDNVEKISHGQVEHRVQGKFMAYEILSWHLSIAAGRAIVRGASTTNDTSTHTFTLLRWAWVKMAPHFNLCDRNPVSYFSRAWGKLHSSCLLTLFLPDLKDPKPWKFEIVQSVSAGMLNVGMKVTFKPDAKPLSSSSCPSSLCSCLYPP
jgi:hypothetical protein